MLEIGSQAPDFTLPTDGNGEVTLSGLQGAPVILYFYPKDDTSGCTKEACDFRESFAEFGKRNVTILGASPDPVKKHDKFKAKYDLPFSLVSDEEKGMLAAYGVWVEKSMYGRKYMGVERSTFLIDAHGKIQAVWRKVKVPGHVDAVLKALDAPTEEA
ncbi:MAG: thioredoxin-dependent thiol peroxidase [Alphaproteobacteria bacterium]